MAPPNGRTGTSPFGRSNSTFFGSDTGGRTAVLLMSFIAMCKRNAVEPFAWFRDVLSKSYCRTIGDAPPEIGGAVQGSGGTVVE